MDYLHSDEYIDKAPHEIYASLLDQNKYLCSISSMYRILQNVGEVKERRNQLKHPHYSKPELLAVRSNQVWSWDITKLLGPVKWTYYYLYVILDIFSRYVAGWLVADRESASLAQQLIEEVCLKQSIDPNQLTIHADRGSPMKAKMTVLFKTMKYRPEFPKRFGCLEDAKSFCRVFFHWYNTEHRHTGIGLLTPEIVHYGLAEKVIDKRNQVLIQAYREHPERFVRKIPVAPALPDAVWINPPGKDDAKERILL